MSTPRPPVDPTLVAAINGSVVVTQSLGGTRVQGPVELPHWIGVRVQADLINRMVDRLFRKTRANAQVQGKRDVLFPPEVAEVGIRFAEALRKKILDTALQPVDQAHVERLLGISRVECNRWSKDGRLSSSGFLTMSRTPHVKIRRATYPPTLLNRLWKHPEIIEHWRKNDKEESGSTC